MPFSFKSCLIHCSQHITNKLQKENCTHFFLATSDSCFIKLLFSSVLFKTSCSPTILSQLQSYTHRKKTTNVKLYFCQNYGAVDSRLGGMSYDPWFRHDKKLKHNHFTDWIPKTYYKIRIVTKVAHALKVLIILVKWEWLVILQIYASVS